MAKGLGRGEGFSWTGDLLEHLPEEVDTGTVFPLWALDANIVRRHPRPRMNRCVARTKVMEIIISDSKVNRNIYIQIDNSVKLNP